MFNKNKITLETRENKLEKIKKKGLRKTLFTTVMSMGVLLGCTGMLVGCGEAGPKGDTGATGPAGPQGVAGSSFLTDEGAPASAYGANGDVYLDTTTFNLYKKVDGVWTELGNIKGDQGEPGEPAVAPTVDINDDGYWVINGVPTDQKAQGEAGATPTVEINDDGYWVINGQVSQVKAEALDGTKGADGNTWAVGTEYPATPNTNDMFLNNTTWEVYKYNGEDWVSVGNIKGGQGEQGATGATGPQGETGAAGSSWITGTTVPTSAIGNNGDTYLDITTNYIYTKTSGVWNKIGELAGDRDITIQQQASPWTNKTAVFVGDSITYGAGCDGDKYWEVLADELGFAKVTGMGVNGSCFSATSDYGTNREPLINRYNNIPEADLIQIFMGTNDYGHGTPLGTINDTTDISFYGALNVILPALQQKYPSARIVVCTPLHRYNANTTTQTLTYDYLPHPVSGNTLEDYVDAMKEVCQRYSIPVIDLFNISGLNPTVTAMKNMYMPDGLHPNTDGHKLIANIMKYHLNLYATSEEQTVVTPNYQLELTTGNLFSTDSATQSNTARATTLKNIYLEKDTVVSVKDSSKYNIAVYSQTGEDVVASSSISGGYVDTFTITESGYYGFVLSQDDGSEFNFVSMSKEFYDYVTIEELVAETSNQLTIGNLFGSGTSLTDATRATLTKNIYLKADTTITVKDASKHNIAVYAQTSETITTSTNISGGYQTEYTVTEDGWYGFVLNNTSEFDFTSDSTNFYDYVTVDEEAYISIVLGNKYYTGNADDATRASASKNIYLKAGTIISLKDANYLYGIFAQTGESVVASSTGDTTLQSWTAENYTISEDGWYGFAVAHDDKTTVFDFNSDSDNIYDYITITEPVEQENSSLDGITLVTGNKYDTTYATNSTRASINKNVYLKAGTTISLKDTNYLYGVFAQSSETVEINTCLQTWTAEDYVITTDGWYGIAFAHDDKTTNFDFTTADSINASDYIVINS